MLASTHYPSGSGRYHLQPLLSRSTEPPNHLSLDPQTVTKLAVKLHARSVQCDHKLVSTRCALEKTFAANHHQDQEWGTASHPPNPH